jgi:hypothetical protein
MTAEQFVKVRYPKAQIQKFEQGAGIAKSLRKVYYLCFSEYRGNRLSEGNTRAECWKNAKGNILEEDTTD